MKRYTIGAVFTPNFKNVILIEKKRPAWQKGKLNFPGGHIEDGETARDCIVREFEEETSIVIVPENWTYIGRIDNPENYYVDFFTAVCDNMSLIQSPTEEICSWYSTETLPQNVVSNLRWLIPFAINVLTQGNHDCLRFGHFEYEYEKQKTN